ncbi:glycosyltransferase family 2 protein [Cochleicola gelatinilyticus]|uniref:Glycosyl transferase n=1 Tax=Cochleicola gelatinilyticus TaxID=1763537 RepID=A0A167J0Z6_9FLAO|nr:glycosyltransferase family 2 protein [Cochleicola gelatinilyticus]OAB80215.1 glycosyl transferase [Cochleicola gelatinilyticus]
MHYEEKKKHISKSGNPLVSIITPMYNAAPYIEKTIQSLQKQSYLHWEQIIVDDASTDNSVEIAEMLSAKNARIKIIKLSENKGAAYCRNLATEAAKGSMIAFLDADDLWHEDKLELQLRFMDQNNCLVSYTSYFHINDKGDKALKRIKALPSVSYEKELTNNYIGNLTGMYNVEVLGKILAPDIRKRQDWAVWLEAIKRSEKPAMGLQKDLAFYRIHEGGMSSKKRSLIKYNFQFYRNHLGYSQVGSLWRLSKFFWEYFFVRPNQIDYL